MNSAETFEKNGYVVLSDVLKNEECKLLVDHMFNLHEQGILTKDPQCPLSDSVYGDPTFDNLLEKMAGPIGFNVGRKLLPTYTYARIYRPGEVLKRHKDRPACEISATLTLGYDADSVWPIMFDEEKEIMVELEAGEMAVYKGCDVMHWRAPFKGNWHVQVFLHYVDADGPYADQALDGRASLGVSDRETKNNKISFKKPETVKDSPKLPEAEISRYNNVLLPEQDNFLPGYVPVNSDIHPELMFTKEECERIISITKNIYPNNASVGGTKEEQKIAKQIRSADVYNISSEVQENRWIFEKVIRAVKTLNDEHFKYDVSGIMSGLQLIHYRSDTDVKGHYDWHVDAGNGNAATRKISFTAQLSDPSTYEGCDLMVDNHCHKVQAVREQGSISLFPSYMPHVVTPIVTGERYALVIWIHGPRRFR